MCFGRAGAELVSVSHASYKEVSEAALEEARQVWESVDTACVLRIVSTFPPEVVLRSEGPGRTVGGDARLCRVEAASAGTSTSTRSAFHGGSESVERAAVLALVDSTRYLTAPGNWEAFLNKVTYCVATGRRLYAWVGTLPLEVLDARPGPLPWMTCKEAPGNTLNIYKAIAFLALFHGRDPGWQKGASMALLNLGVVRARSTRESDDPHGPDLRKNGERRDDL